MVGANTFPSIPPINLKIKAVKSEAITCEEARQIDLVDYLAKLGHYPTKIRRFDYWYLSPLRDEKNSSFKVNRNMNLWFDHGTGTGGNLIDFGKLYYECTVRELLIKLAGEENGTLSFHHQSDRKEKESQTNERKIKITDSREIRDPHLRKYLGGRNIPSIIASRFCSEIEFELNGKKHLAIGFKNDRGGYELRNEHFKGGSSPKSITWIKNDPERLSIFEGFFDFLSFQTVLISERELVHELTKNQDSYIILNSLAFFEKRREIIEQHQRINLFFDHDEAGLSATKKALKWSDKYIDESHRYTGFKDLNEFHIHSRQIDLKENRCYHGRL